LPLGHISNTYSQQWRRAQLREIHFLAIAPTIAPLPVPRPRVLLFPMKRLFPWLTKCGLQILSPTPREAKEPNSKIAASPVLRVGALIGPRKALETPLPGRKHQPRCTSLGPRKINVTSESATTTLWLGLDTIKKDNIAQSLSPLRCKYYHPGHRVCFAPHVYKATRETTEDPIVS
jgi:hypothetical protein